jgi:hypothetical protein
MGGVCIEVSVYEVLLVCDAEVVSLHGCCFEQAPQGASFALINQALLLLQGFRCASQACNGSWAETASC